MRALTQPTLQGLAAFELCLVGVQNAAVKGAFESVALVIEAAAQEYVQKSLGKNWYQLAPSKFVGTNLPVAQMTWLYDKRFVQAVQPRAELYDVLIALAPCGRCPLCGSGSVSTLDHYLPKAKYPHYAVLPLNLVASCFDCNKTKQDPELVSAATQPLHAYFDSIDDYDWVTAMTHNTTPPVVTFRVATPAGADPILALRVREHFRVFDLAKRYGVLAAQLLQDNALMHQSLRADSPNELRKHLMNSADSYRNVSRNAWQAAMYKALAGSEWFVKGA